MNSNKCKHNLFIMTMEDHQNFLTITIKMKELKNKTMIKLKLKRQN